MLPCHEPSFLVSSPRLSLKPLTLTIYKGFGGDHIVIDAMETAVDLLNAVEQRTDWLWGYCRQHASRRSDSHEFLPWDHQLLLLRNMDSSEIIALNCSLIISSSMSIQIEFLPLRISRVGFPCFKCMHFVHWNYPCWYTRYRLRYPDYFTVPAGDFMIPMLSTDYVRYLLHPRDYYCEECGPKIDDWQRYHLEIVRWSSATSSYAYTWAHD